MSLGNEQPTRRDALRIAAVAAAGCALPIVNVTPAAATPADMQAAISQIVGRTKVEVGKVRLDIPPLVENGNTVACTISVESPMTAADHVKAIHVLSERNPQPNVVSAFIGPRAGRATISTRIRLADTQTVIGLAQLSDGSFWSTTVNVVVTVGACLEE